MSSSRSCSLCLSNFLFLLLSAFLYKSSASAASLRDHRLRESSVPNEDMLKALEYIQSLRQNSNLQDQPPKANMERSLLAPQSDKPEVEDKSEELLQAVLSTLQQTEKAAKPSPKSLDIAKPQAITPHKEMPLLFEDDEKQDAEEASEDFDHSDNFKRMNENVEEKYTPQNLATLQSVFDELGKMNFNFNSKRENTVEDDSLLNVRDAAYDDRDWDEDAEENRREFERALDYLEETEPENDFISKRSDDENDGEMANLADFYLLKVLEQTEEQEQKKRELEEEEELEEERVERSVADFRNNMDPKMIYRLLQISQKYQVPPEDLVDMLKTRELPKLKVAPVYAKKPYKKPEYITRIPIRQKSREDMVGERILRILGFDENQLRKHQQIPYSRPSWRPSLISKQPQLQQRSSTKLKDDYDDTDNELATFLAARMLMKYPMYDSRFTQKREETEDDSFERAVQDYFDHLQSDRNENRQSNVEKREVEGFDNEDVMKLLSLLSPDEQDAKSTE